MAKVIDLSNRPKRPTHPYGEWEWIWDNIVLKSFWSLYQHGVCWVKDPNESIFLSEHNFDLEEKMYWWADGEREMLSISTSAVDVSEKEYKETLAFISFAESIRWRVEVEEVVSPTTGCKGWKIYIPNYQGVA